MKDINRYFLDYQKKSSTISTSFQSKCSKCLKPTETKFQNKENIACVYLDYWVGIFYTNYGILNAKYQILTCLHIFVKILTKNHFILSILNFVNIASFCIFFIYTSSKCMYYMPFVVKSLLFLPNALHLVIVTIIWSLFCVFLPHFSGQHSGKFKLNMQYYITVNIYTTNLRQALRIPNNPYPLNVRISD